MSVEFDRLESALRVRIQEDTEESLEAMAINQSEPGDRVTKSDVVRDAIADYLEQHDD
jgi:predicted DNA-binding protein